MNKQVALYLGAAIMMAPCFANAFEMHYVAKPEQSTWTLATDTPLECRLIHTIPNFGDAEFSSHAGKKINLDFELKMLRPMGETRDVSLVSLPPAWRPGESADRLTTLKFFKQFDGYVGGQTAWTMLSELEKGRYPTFSYNEWQSSDKRIEIGLSSVLFQQPYNAFNACISKLLPYGFEDISFTILHYDQGDSIELNKASQKRLAQIAEYIRYNKDIDLVLVATYTDSMDTKDVSQDLSEKRAESLRKYFESLGLAQDRIQVEGYGKRRPVADNASPIGKQKNRRVVISLGRSEMYY